MIEAVARVLTKRIIKTHNIDPLLEHEIIDMAMLLHRKHRTRIQRAVVAATLYALAKRGIDITNHKLLPRHARPRNGRASIAFLMARLADSKEHRDELDEYVRSYAYVIYLATKHSLPAELVEKARQILWAARSRLIGQDTPLVTAKEALRAAKLMSSKRFT